MQTQEASRQQREQTVKKTESLHLQAQTLFSSDSSSLSRDEALCLQALLSVSHTRLVSKREEDQSLGRSRREPLSLDGAERAEYAGWRSLRA